MKDLVLLGSTGSIGTQVLEVVDHLAPEWNVLALSAHQNIDLLEQQIRQYKPDYACIGSDRLAVELEHRLQDRAVQVDSGPEQLSRLAALEEADLVINSIVGAAGLPPSLNALKAGNRLGLANKESLVIGGELMEKWMDREDPNLLPVDSEHNAIFEILKNKQSTDINRVLLTASGGPFLNYTREQLEEVTVEQALDHPNWDMGNKITIDSATMINKGLEVMEAHWLFDQPYSQIEVVIHPESIIHSMVAFIDNTIAAEMSVSDMRITIQNVLTFPEKKPASAPALDLFEVGQLNFTSPDFSRFPGLKLAYKAGKAGGSLPAVFNAANEVAVAAFLGEKIPFLQIPGVIERVLEGHNRIAHPSLEDIFAVDRQARKRAEEVIAHVYNHS